LLFALVGCIKDDLVADRVDPIIRIQNPIDSLAINTSYQFDAMYLNRIGEEESVAFFWSSSDTSVIQIDQNGLATGVQFGASTVKVQALNDADTVTTERVVHVGTTTVASILERTGTVNTTSTYALSGDFKLTEEMNGDLRLAFESDYNASTALPGLYIYLSNNPNSVSNALEIGAVQVFSGAHDYTIPNVGLYDYQYVVYFCKPFNVKVGHGEISE